MHTKYNKDTTKWLVKNYGWTEIDLALELTTRSNRILRENNITTIKQLKKMSNEDFLALKGFGKKSLKEVKTQLSYVK